VSSINKLLEAVNFPHSRMGQNHHGGGSDLIELVDSTLRAAKLGHPLEYLRDSCDDTVVAVTVNFDGQFPLTAEHELPGVLREAGDTYRVCCEMAARRAERVLAEGTGDHLSAKERTACRKIAARIRRAFNAVPDAPLAFCDVPLTFHPDDLPDTDEDLRYGITLTIQPIEIVADFRKQPEHVIPARLRDAARAYERIAENLERLT
jgi:hypothetical protein